MFQKSEFLDDVTLLKKNSYEVGVTGDKFVFQTRLSLLAQGIQDYMANEESSDYLKKVKGLTYSLDKEGNPILFLVEFNF